MEDNAAVILRLDNGGSASIRLDYLRPLAAPGSDTRIRIAGSLGIVDLNGGKVTLATNDQPPETVPPAPEVGFLSDFLDSLKGEKEHLISMEEAYKANEICFKAREAAEKGEVLKL